MPPVSSVYFSSPTTLWALAGTGYTTGSFLLEATKSNNTWTWVSPAPVSGPVSSTNTGVSFTVDGTNGGSTGQTFGQGPRAVGNLIGSAGSKIFAAAEDAIVTPNSPYHSTVPVPWRGATANQLPQYYASGMAVDPNTSDNGPEGTNSAWITIASRSGDSTTDDGLWWNGNPANATNTNGAHTPDLCQLTPAGSGISTLATDVPEEVVATTTPTTTSTVLYVLYANSGLYQVTVTMGSYTTLNPDTQCANGVTGTKTLPTANWTQITVPSSSLCQQWSSLAAATTSPGVTPASTTIWAGCQNKGTANGINSLFDLTCPVITATTPATQSTSCATTGIGQQCASSPSTCPVSDTLAGDTPTWAHVVKPGGVPSAAQAWPAEALAGSNYGSSQIAIDPASPTTVLTAGTGGAWITTGSNPSDPAEPLFQPDVVGLGDTIATSVASDPGTPNDVAVGDADWGVQFSTNSFRNPGTGLWEEDPADSTDTNLGTVLNGIGGSLKAPGQSGNYPQQDDHLSIVDASSGPEILGSGPVLNELVNGQAAFVQQVGLNTIPFTPSDTRSSGWWAALAPNRSRTVKARTTRPSAHTPATRVPTGRPDILLTG